MKGSAAAGAVVVKFGGSLLGSAGLKAMLAVASDHGAIVVPGGGRFADVVRREQARIGFSDSAAHAMAILAMDQTARCFADAAPELALVATGHELDAAISDRRPAIWSPSPLAMAADLPASWDVTSDSLAIWLAIRLRARRLVLLKSADCAKDAGLDELAAEGVVDPHAPSLAAEFRGDITVVGPATAEGLQAALSAQMRRAA